ncbi:hypothetical protein ATO5_05935 [Loktanella sp. 22II-4b]|nr:hypothetical protein ATO5_05935 [Loktanella sp. 22II-4b]
MKTNDKNCTALCWQISAAAGVLSFVILWLLAGFSLLGALALGVVLTVLLGVLLAWGLCRGTGKGTLGTTTGATTDPVADAARAGADIPADPSATLEAGQTAAHRPPVAPAPQPAPAPAPARDELVDKMPPHSPVAPVDTADAGLADTSAATPVEPAPAAQDPVPGARVAAARDAEAPGTAAAERRPEGLAAPRDGKGDDLTRIRGVGPKLAAMLNGMGYFHFDQIAAWDAGQVAWVDQNLTGFRGRVSRDEWVAQAARLAGEGQGR